MRLVYLLLRGRNQLNTPQRSTNNVYILVLYVGESTEFGTP